jgi:DNA primase
MSIDEILARLMNVRRGGKGYTARCPSHQDRNNSLSVGTGGDGRTLLHCFTGCTFEQIVEALGLEPGDAFPDSGRRASSNGKVHHRPEPVNLARLALAKGLPEYALREYNVEDHFRGVLIRYAAADGSPVRQRLRTTASAKGSSWLLPETPSAKIVPYGVWRSYEGVSSRVIVEGESDCWTLWHGAQAPAIGIPGASMCHVLEAKHVAGLKKVWVVREPDAAGGNFVASIARRLRDLNWPGEILELRMPDGIKDPNALWLRDPETFKSRLFAAMKSAPLVPVAPAADAVPELATVCAKDVKIERTHWLMSHRIPL